MRLRRLKQIRLLTILLAIVILIGTPSFPTSFTTGVVSAAPSSPLSIQSEEENIDDFSVHPASGRWNTTSDALTDDRIVDDNLRLITVDNTTTGTAGFEMNRDLRKTDGKVEWRSKADGSGNQTEYFRDIIGDSMDFEEGDVEGLGSANTISATDGVVSFASDADFRGFNFVFAGGLEPNFNLMNTISFRIKSNKTGLMQLLFRFQLPGQRSHNFETSTEWQTITLNLADFTEANNPESLSERFDLETRTAHSDYPIGFEMEFLEITMDLDFATHIEGEIEDTLDFEEGDDEATDFDLAGVTIVGGFYNGSAAIGAADDVGWDSWTDVDTDLFITVKVKVNASSTVQMRINGFDGGFKILSEYQNVGTSQTVFTYDLSLDSDWTGSFQGILLHFIDDSGNFEGDEIIAIDYALLLGEWAAVDSTIGLYDDDVTGPLLNVSTHFWSDSDVGARYEIELLDLSGEIAYRAVSANFTDLGDLWVRGKITYDSLRSSLIVDMKADNGSRIIKVTFPKDFTSISGRIPALFQTLATPGVFISTFTPAISWQELTIGYIRAPFKENEWKNTGPPTDPNYLENFWDIAYVEDNTNDLSNWTLNVPSLDSVSGRMSIKWDNLTTGNNGDDVAMHFLVYGVDADDGDLHLILGVRMQIQKLAPNIFQVSGGIQNGFGPGIAIIKLIGAQEQLESKLFTSWKDIAMDFSMGLSEDRTKIHVKSRLNLDITNTSDIKDYVSEETISDYVDSPSSEFVLFVNYWVELVADNEVKCMLEDFGFVARDIFTDIIHAVVEPIGNFISQIFTAAFLFLAGIFKAVGDIIGLAIEVMTAALTIAIGLVTSAIVAMQTALETAIGLVTTAITTLQGALETAIGLVTTAVDAVTTAIGVLAADIATAVWDGIGAALDFITDAIADIASDVADAIVQVLDDVVTFLLTLIADIAELVDDVLQVVIPLLLTFLGTLLTDIAGFLEDVINTLIDLIVPVEITALFEAIATAVVEIITAIPTFIADIMTFLAGVAAIFVVAGFIIFFILPIAQGASAGDFLSHSIDNMSFDITFGISILGTSLTVPAVLPWIVLMVFQMLTGTPFIDFF